MSSYCCSFTSENVKQRLVQNSLKSVNLLRLASFRQNWGWNHPLTFEPRFRDQAPRPTARFLRNKH